MNAKPDMAGDHASGTSGFITCTHANKSETDIKLGISVDQVAAQKIGMQTRLPSLQLGIDGGGGTGNCDSGYSCAYARNISWSDAATPLPKIVDPFKPSTNCSKATIRMLPRPKPPSASPTKRASSTSCWPTSTAFLQAGRH